MEYKNLSIEEKSIKNKIGKWPKMPIILLGASFSIIIILLRVLIYLATNNSKLRANHIKKNKINFSSFAPTELNLDIITDLSSKIYFTFKESNSPQDPVELNTFSYFGKIYKNLSYVENNVIYNSFKKGGENYKEDIGNINNGTDYTPNDRNMYDLYIPKYSERRKKEINGVILWIHGGAWIEGTKEGNDLLCQFYSQVGYISATLGYTLLVPGKYSEFNIYRMIDEITACIKAIKQELISRGFEGDKLRLAIGGYSAGAHLTLLYSYLISQNIIPLKFIIDIAGPIGLNMKYFQKLADGVKPFNNITDVNVIENAVKEGKIIEIVPAITILNFMNLFLGNRYTSENITSILDEDGNIKTENEIYKQMLKALKYADVTQIEDQNPNLPTICIYGGKDDTVGVTAYAYLKNTTKRKLNLIYSKYEGHMLILPKTIDGADKMSDMSASIMEYSKKYFFE